MESPEQPGPGFVQTPLHVNPVVLSQGAQDDRTGVASPGGSEGPDAQNEIGLNFPRAGSWVSAGFEKAPTGATGHPSRSFENAGFAEATRFGPHKTPSQFVLSTKREEIAPFTSTLNNGFR